MLIIFRCGFADNPKEQDIELREISAFEIPVELNRTLIGGQGVVCETLADPNVTYPDLTSEKSLYGSILLPRGLCPEPEERWYHFVIDESDGTGSGYDRLWFDSNFNLDLTDDKTVSVISNPPEGALLQVGKTVEQQVCFEYLNINFPFGSEGERPLEVMPRLIVSSRGYSSLRLVTTKAHTGEVEIAGHKYYVLLGHKYLISGWFDQPSTNFELIPQKKSERGPTWLYADFLLTLHKIEGQYYRFSATPAGDKLYVRPYVGDFGIFQIGSGWRFVFNEKMDGSLLSRDAAVAVEGEWEDNRPARIRSCLLPVGDYLPVSLTITFGNLRLDVSDNYYSDGKSRDINHDKVYGIKIRRDKPFVLDFSNKPQVIFASPAVNTRIKPGEQLQVEAVLVDPKLNIMIRSIESKPYQGFQNPDLIKYIAALIIPVILFWFLPSRLRKKYRILPVTFIIGILILTGLFIFLQFLVPSSDYDRIKPQVIISRADGEKVISGVMPFG